MKRRVRNVIWARKLNCRRKKERLEKKLELEKEVRITVRRETLIRKEIRVRKEAMAIPGREVLRLLAAEVSALFLHFPLSFCHQRQLIQWETAKVVGWWPLAFYYSLSLSLSFDPADPTAKVAPSSLSPSLSLFLSPSKRAGHNDS